MIPALSLFASLAVFAPGGPPAAAAPEAPAAAPASCSSWRKIETELVRFRATIRAIEPLGTTPTTARLVGGNGEQRFVVQLAVASAEPNPEIAAGELLNLAIHSPSESFGGAGVGATLDLDMLREYCDGKLWRFFSLRPRPAKAPQPYNRFLRIGDTLRVPVEWDPEAKSTVFTGDLDLPMHYGGDIDWQNPADVKSLDSGHPWGSMVLEVRAITSEHLDDTHYQMTFHCTFIALEPCRPCTAGK
jgi:hypothetical protein